MPSKWEKHQTKRKRLSDRQRHVIDLYFGAANFCKTHALRMAGYGKPEKYIRFFNNPVVIEEIERRHRRLREKYEVSYENVVNEIAKIAFSNVLDYARPAEDGFLEVDFSMADAHALAAIGEVKVEEPLYDKDGNQTRGRRVLFKPWNKLSALDQLMRHAGLSKDKASEALVDVAARLGAGLNRIGGGAKEEGKEDADS